MLNNIITITFSRISKISKIPKIKILALLIILNINFSYLSLATFSLSNQNRPNKINYSTKTYLFKQSDGTGSGQEVVDYFRQVFQSDWKIGDFYNSSSDGYGFSVDRTQSFPGSPSFTRKEFGEYNGVVEIIPILSPDNSEGAIIDLIKSANQSLLIEQMYIYPELTEIVNEIKNAKLNRGVNCCVIVGDSNDNSNETAYDLSQSGVNVKVFDGTSPLYMDDLHNKGVIVDGEITLISSINWSPTSLRENREAGLIIKSIGIAQYYTELFNTDWDGSDNYDSLDSFKSYYVSNSFSFSSSFFPSFSDFDEFSVPLASPKSSEYSNKFENLQVFAGSINFRLAASPDNCYGVLTNELAIANQSIDISVYTLSSPFIMDAIADRIAHGVQVRLLLGEPLGSYERNYNRWSMANFTEIGIPSFSNPSVNLTARGKWASSEFYFQHCKYAIIDNQTLVLSSGNWSQNSCPLPDAEDEVRGNRDWWVVLYGLDPSPLPNQTDSTNTDSGEDLLYLINLIKENWIFTLVAGIILIGLVIGVYFVISKFN